MKQIKDEKYKKVFINATFDDVEKLKKQYPASEKWHIIPVFKRTQEVREDRRVKIHIEDYDGYFFVVDEFGDSLNSDYYKTVQKAIEKIDKTIAWDLDMKNEVVTESVVIKPSEEIDGTGKVYVEVDYNDIPYNHEPAGTSTWYIH